jgi:hypothetical protein
MPKVSIVDEIAAAIPESQSGRPWWLRLTAEQQDFIKPILVAWKAGKFGSRRIAAARAISATLGRHGISIGPQGVQNWLQRNA